jgi:hypothetical protein
VIAGFVEIVNFFRNILAGESIFWNRYSTVFVDGRMALTLFKVEKNEVLGVSTRSNVENGLVQKRTAVQILYPAPGGNSRDSLIMHLLQADNSLEKELKGLYPFHAVITGV